MAITPDEYTMLRTGDATPDDIEDKHKEEDRLQLVKNVQTKDFLLRRTTETIKVPIVSSEGVIEVEIRARLSVAETKEHEEFLTKFRRAASDETYTMDDADVQAAKFLAAISVDPELDENLWLQVDDMTMSEILIAFFTEPVKRMADARKFRARK